MGHRLGNGGLPRTNHSQTFAIGASLVPSWWQQGVCIVNRTPTGDDELC